MTFLTILDEHYNNVKVLGCFKPRTLFNYVREKRRWVSDWGVHLSRHLQILAASFPKCFPPDSIAKLKHSCFYGGLPKWLKPMVPYLEASVNEKMYLDNLWVAREAEKEEAWWNLPIARLLIRPVSPRQWVSFLYKSWRSPSLPRPLP